jgi:hypothetical protein
MYNHLGSLEMFYQSLNKKKHDRKIVASNAKTATDDNETGSGIGFKKCDKFRKNTAA